MSASVRFEFRDPGYLKLFSDFFLPRPFRCRFLSLPPFRLGGDLVAELARRQRFSSSSLSATRSAARAPSVSLFASSGGFFSRSFRAYVCVFHAASSPSPTVGIAGRRWVGVGAW
jgi:hypothetical protein